MSTVPETTTPPPPKRVRTNTNGAADPMAEPKLQVKLLSEKGRAPTRGSAFSAGYDLYAAKAATLPAKGKGLIDTDISIACPAGTCKPLTLLIATSINADRVDGRIAPRSGLASKHFIDTGAGVIDADYRGPVKVLLFNHSETDFEVSEGDRVAQLILERIYTPEVVEVQELEESIRGAGGFGSTGGFGSSA